MAKIDKFVKFVNPPHSAARLVKKHVTKAALPPPEPEPED